MSEYTFQSADHGILAKSEPLASLSLQMALAFDKWYFSWVFFFVTLVSSFYKVYRYGLSQSTVEFEVLILIAVQVVNQLRMFIAMKSNKIERASPCQTLSFLAFSILTFLGLLFFLLVQTYTLLLEVIIVAFACLLGLFEFVMMCTSLVSFKSMETSQ